MDEEAGMKPQFDHVLALMKPKDWRLFFKLENVEEGVTHEVMYARAVVNANLYWSNYVVITVGFVGLAIFFNARAAFLTVLGVGAGYAFVTNYKGLYTRTRLVEKKTLYVVLAAYVCALFLFTNAVQLALYGLIAGAAFSALHASLHVAPTEPET